MKKCIYLFILLNVIYLRIWVFKAFKGCISSSLKMLQQCCAPMFFLLIYCVIILSNAYRSSVFVTLSKLLPNSSPPAGALPTVTTNTLPGKLSINWNHHESAAAVAVWNDHVWTEDEVSDTYLAALKTKWCTRFG